MEVLFGAILLIYTGCTFLVLTLVLASHWTPGTGRTPSLRDLADPRALENAKVVAGVIAGLMFVFQWQYRAKFSPEAQAKRAFEQVLEDWEAGNKARVVQTLNDLAGTEKPWDSTPERERD